MVRRELGPIFPHETVQGSALSPEKFGVVPEQVLYTEVAPQLTVQDGSDGGDLGGGEAWLIEEEDELGYKLGLVSNFSIPGSFPGEPRREAVKAFTGMNEICCISAKKVFQAGLTLWSSNSNAHLATNQNAVRHPLNKCLPSARATGDEAPIPIHCSPSLEIAFKDNPQLLTFKFQSSGKTNGGLRKLRTKTADLSVTVSTSQQPGARGPWQACLVCALPATPKPQSG